MSPRSAKRSPPTSTLCSNAGAPPPAAPLDKALVAAVRDMLVGLPARVPRVQPPQRAQVGADIRRSRSPTRPGRGALQVFERASGEPLTKGIPGLFTRDGLSRGLREVGRQGDQAARRRRRVGARHQAGRAAGRQGRWRADRAPRADQPGAPLYFQEYIKIWDKYIADVRLIRMNGLEQSLQVSRALSGVDSPLAGFLRGVARETDAGAAGRARPAATATRRSAASTRRACWPSASSTRCSARSRTPVIEDTGPPLEKMVDDHFAHIHRMFKGTPPPIDEVLKMFNDVYVHLAAVDQAQKTKSRRRPAGGPSASRPRPGSSRADPLGARKALGAAATQGPQRRARRDDERAQADRRRLQPLDHRPLPVHRELEGRRAARRLRPAVRRGGLLDEFYQRKLAPLVDTGTNPWSFKPVDGAKPVNSTALADFQRGARIKEVFFRAGGKTPSFKVDMRALEMAADLKEVNLDIDGQVLKFTAGGPASTVQWPSTRVASQIKVQTRRRWPRR
jgi:type VI secretion system protein ImpL